MKGLKNKRVLITGGASGIGFTTAERFLEEGSQVVILDHDEAACQQARKKLPKLSGILLADVSDDKAVADAFVELDDLLGGLDILINNAGISIRNKFMDIPSDQWRSVVDVNLNGIFYVAQQAANRMLAGDGGVILNMGSSNGLVGYHYYADYNATKAAVIELSRSMALELGPTIRVNAVCPGFIMTPMQAAEYTPEMRRAFEVKVPLQKLGTPEDVAALFAFLASDEAGFITGQHFVIDGGEIAGGLASQA
ncbi:MAG: SDR family oxidoreductase [Anaerolineales bacterium]|uniref:SDR family oxidoreductase n=1 Tax=Candidatus Desulfolinea nitratireducens TaxID=2841698 RepID=A0A8J6TGY6_9CHLR|nr:SDR family oxidoreductase [Candidatus Desulfolinea nitratireducens]MBL6960900.1 SDR family oxidoreductase [Anaerolineales bacterium]